MLPSVLITEIEEYLCNDFGKCYIDVRIVSLFIGNNTTNLVIKCDGDEVRETLSITWSIPRESNKWRKLDDLMRLDILLRARYRVVYTRYDYMHHQYAYTLDFDQLAKMVRCGRIQMARPTKYPGVTLSYEMSNILYDAYKCAQFQVKRNNKPIRQTFGRWKSHPYRRTQTAREKCREAIDLIKYQ